ncbi:hypothetical protein ILYODFUR_022533 [Ilyodon furcidens]|uniref:Secreted protein n=1 Tax=Ilyodon furcidens TaxID=33524 RepID=A0ABV0SZ93_9TELE
MYQTQHVFPFQRRGILCVGVFVCVCQSRRSHWASRNPCSKNRHCVFPALTHHYHRTHTHIYRDHWPILFPLQVSSTPILVPPAVKMFRCDCHETCSLGAKQRTQIGHTHADCWALSSSSSSSSSSAAPQSHPLPPGSAAHRRLEAERRYSSSPR